MTGMDGVAGARAPFMSVTAQGAETASLRGVARPFS